MCSGSDGAEDIAPAFKMRKDDAQALYVSPDALVNANHALINRLSAGGTAAYSFTRSATISTLEV